METAFVSALNSLYSCHGQDCTYTGRGMDAFSCKVLQSTVPDQFPGGFESQVHIDRIAFAVRRSDVTRPTTEDYLVVDGTTYLVTEHQPKNAYEWLLTVSEYDG